MEVRKLVHSCCFPVYAELLRPRVVALSVAALGAAQVCSSMFLGWGFPCMFHQLTGIPCPGCGLTRSVMALLRGRVADSVAFHPFGPPLLLALALALVAAIMPAFMRDRLIGTIAAVETKTGLAAILFALFMIVWVLRIFSLVPLNTLR